MIYPLPEKYHDSITRRIEEMRLLELVIIQEYSDNQELDEDYYYYDEGDYYYD